MYEDGNELNYDSDITGDTLEEVKDKLYNKFSTRSEQCSICGKILNDGDTIYKTEDGQTACNLVELLSELSGQEVS